MRKSNFLMTCLALLYAVTSVYAQGRQHTTTTHQATDSTGGIGTTAPGNYPYSPEQDKAFYEALNEVRRLRIPPALLFQQSLQRVSPKYIEILEEHAKDYAWLDIPKFWLIPTFREQFEREYNRTQATFIPGISTGRNGGGITATFSWQQLLADVGLIPDLSPKISYTVEQTAEVSVSVYSIQAIAVANIFKSIQIPGSYTVWCTHDRKGKRVPRGYYAAEAQIGNITTVRKQISID